jgi:peroxiredoxin
MTKRNANIAKRLLQISLSSLLALILFSCSQHSVDSYDSQGKVIRLSHYLGKWVVINYWATWCKPCLTEMPALERLHNQYKNKIIVLGVSFDKLDNNAINQIAKKNSLTYPMLSVFPMQKFGIDNIDILPVTFIINPQGKLVKTLKGPQTETQFAQALGIQTHG